VFRVYKVYIENSEVLNISREFLKSKNYIDATVENVPQQELLAGLTRTVSEYTKWLTNLAKNLPGLSDLNLEDFMTIISNGSLLSIAIHMNEFYTSTESYHISHNGLQMSRNRMNIVFGSFNALLIILIHRKIKELCLSEMEKALFYPFILFSCNG
jgi:hypothetical protein